VGRGVGVMGQSSYSFSVGVEMADSPMKQTIVPAEIKGDNGGKR
jgi:hypothetical protein